MGDTCLQLAQEASRASGMYTVSQETSKTTPRRKPQIITTAVTPTLMRLRVSICCGHYIWLFYM